MNPPPRPVEGVISWNINTACNYRCSYCTQRFKDDRTRWSRDTDRFLEAFSRLPGQWEVKISGGEPFVHPTLFEIVAGLSSLGFRISVVTNFSASVGRLERFIEAAAGRVGIFSASLHLEYVEDIDAFLDKAVLTRDALLSSAVASCPPPSLCVTSVATRAALPALSGLARRFTAAGIPFKLQPEKQESKVIPYTALEEDLLLSLGGHNLTGEIEHRYKGRPCWAGARYLILDDRGEAYRCYPARRQRRDYLGNFLSGEFRLLPDVSPCWYETCHCTVPISRGMMSKTSEEEPDEVQDV
ncbi:MAG: radical SAM protein [Thermoanaerobaculia bacterium]|nr:radical SAM protein [Thermoanaerobaculia bacterium]